MTTLLAAAATSCINSDTVDGPVEMTLYNIVTFEGNAPTATFAYYPPGSDDARNLRSEAHAVDTAVVRTGQRVYAAYVVLADNIIDLKGLSLINNDTLRGLAAAPGAADGGSSVDLIALWRSGQYIDVRLRLPYSTEPRDFFLAVDSATIAGPVAQLYLIHRLPADVSPDDTFSRAYYASFDISSLWCLPQIDAVEVNVDNSNVPSQSKFKFKKNR